MPGVPADFVTGSGAGRLAGIARSEFKPRHVSFDLPVFTMI